MESYSAHITPYLMEVAEGSLSGELFRPNYTAPWIDLFTNEFMRYPLDNDKVVDKWDGNQSAIMASTPQVWESMLGFLRATTAEDAERFQAQSAKGIKETLSFFLKTDDTFATEFSDSCASFATMEQARYYAYDAAEKKGTANHSVNAAIRALGATIWRFRLYNELHIAYLAAEGDQENLLSQTFEVIQKIATSPERVSEIYAVVSWPARMVLHDLLDLEKGVDAIKHLSSKARNRILLQCEGYGGFQFEKFGRTLEISTMFEGASGIFLRAIGNPTQNDGKYEDLKTKKVTASYRGKLTFGAAKELKERKILGWISNSTNAPLNYVRVKNKTFLDHLTPGAGNVSKLILYMNWYFGGMTSWYSGIENDTSGSLMRQEATEKDVVDYAEAIKIDSHFSIGNIVACSKLPSDGSIDNLIHHTLAYRMGDIAVYRRKRTAGLAVIGGFAPEDCQFEMVNSLVGEQDELEEVVNGAYPWTR